MIWKLLVVGLGGFVGAVSRYLLSGAVYRWSSASFPTGTLVVNVLGCLLIGALMYLVEGRPVLGPNGRAFLVIGLLGSLTTFSTVGYETFQFIRDGDWHLVMLNVACNLIIGIAAVAAGWTAVKALGS